MSKNPKRPRDTNQLAKLIVDVATGEEQLPEDKPNKKNPAAVALGKLGGLKGGKARAANLTKEKRSEIAKKAATKRWEKRENTTD
jgi:hypothetical protein